MTCQIGLPAAMILTDLVWVSDTFQEGANPAYLTSSCWLKTKMRTATANASAADNDILFFLMMILQRMKLFFVTPFCQKSIECINKSIWSDFK
ncbi:MAG: hypothetical protein RLZZ172_2959 [Bacteroidota bacterium]